MELDRRNLPAPVLSRLTEQLGPEFLTSRHPGFDINYKNKVLEQRVHRGIETRTSDTGAPMIIGYATVYDHAYDVLGGPPYGWDETIVGGAAAKSIAEQDEVYLFFDHEGLPLSATKDSSLVLRSDKIGLYNESTVDSRSNWNMEVWNRVDSGLLDSMSFAFRATRQEWNADYTERFITEVQLFDVSVVSFPANPFTSVLTRDADPPEAGAFSLALALHQADALRLAIR